MQGRNKPGGNTNLLSAAPACPPDRQGQAAVMPTTYLEPAKTNWTLQNVQGLELRLLLPRCTGELAS